MSEEGHEYFYFLTAKDNVTEDPILEPALKSFHESLPLYIRKIMLESEYEHSETEENNASYISLLSKVLTIEAGELIRYLNRNKKKRKFEDSSQPKLPSLCSEELKLSECSIQLISLSKRHNIYYVINPQGIKALKTSVDDITTTEVE